MAADNVRPAPRLYLVTPALAAVTAFSPLLEAALEAGDVACVLIRLAARDPTEAAKIVKTLASLVQTRGAALLVADDPQLAVRCGADGVHIQGRGAALENSLDDAIARMKPHRIVGVGPVQTKHEAMTVAEKDIDYLLFGDLVADSGGSSAADVRERVAWWSEIFTVPCVGSAQRLADVGPVAAAGADFVAIGDAVWNDPRGAAAAVREAQAALGAAQARESVGR